MNTKQQARYRLYLEQGNAAEKVCTYKDPAVHDVRATLPIEQFTLWTDKKTGKVKAQTWCSTCFTTRPTKKIVSISAEAREGPFVVKQSTERTMEAGGWRPRAESLKGMLAAGERLKKLGKYAGPNKILITPNNWGDLLQMSDADLLSIPPAFFLSKEEEYVAKENEEQVYLEEA